ncbi:hypothetical protein ABIE27_000348 [Paenibacillus sp. 4624]
MILLIAKRKIKLPCAICNKKISKGECYWKDRRYYNDDDGFGTVEWHYCPRCKYKEEDRSFRMIDLHMRCSHPPAFVHYEGDPDNYNGHVCGICNAKHLIKRGDVYTTSLEDVVW